MAAQRATPTGRMRYRSAMEGLPIKTPWMERLRAWARRLQRDALTLWLALRHPQTPWLAKGLTVVVVAYALSPIDLIPDFIPVLGLVDDILLLPGLIWLALAQLPAQVLVPCREEAERRLQAGLRAPRSLAGAALVVLVWMGALAAGWWWWHSA